MTTTHGLLDSSSSVHVSSRSRSCHHLVSRVVSVSCHAVFTCTHAHHVDNATGELIMQCSVQHVGWMRRCNHTSTAVVHLLSPRRLGHVNPATLHLVVSAATNITTHINDNESSTVNTDLMMNVNSVDATCCVHCIVWFDDRVVLFTVEHVGKHH